MLITGLKMMLVGMLMVLLFLLLLVLLIKLIEILSRSHTFDEEQQLNQRRQSTLKQESTEASFPIVVLAAALAVDEADRR